jgi:hypothetical protein
MIYEANDLFIWWSCRNLEQVSVSDHPRPHRSTNVIKSFCPVLSSVHQSHFGAWDIFLRVLKVLEL